MKSIFITTCAVLFILCVCLFYVGSTQLPAAKAFSPDFRVFSDITGGEAGRSTQPKEVTMRASDQEIFLGMKLTSGETVYINGEIGDLNLKAPRRSGGMNQDNPDTIFDQEFEIGVKLEHGTTISVNTSGNISVKDMSEPAWENALTSASKGEKQSSAPSKTNRPNAAAMQAELPESALIENAVAVEDVPSGVMISLGEKVTFFTSGVVARQKSQTIDQNRQKDGKQHGRVSSDSIDHDIFDLELEGGITLTAGEKIVFRDDGGIVLLQKTSATSSAARQLNTRQKTAHSISNQEKDSIFLQELTGGITLKEGQSVSISSDGEIIGYRAIAHKEKRRHDDDLFIQEVTGGIMVSPGEKVTFYTNGVVSSQIVQKNLREVSVILLDSGQLSLSDSVIQSIFDMELEGGITLNPGDRIVFSDNGKISLLKNSANTGSASSDISPRTSRDIRF